MRQNEISILERQAITIPSKGLWLKNIFSDDMQIKEK